ncbi:hypothetical protein [Luteococcus japonicus]|uniref:Uncharacterized protein n=1 Tax=Luteococcus japonicus LSP_Lj1 TaxID=1255658 RepID=A0A1R4KKP8_9ACTN|nr:hypothetical protein [Luteococcus japonicus]SJN44936.1 hypothetical protein FM114_15475 [Luteococcus japonicus LSP_Lj1]
MPARMVIHTPVVDLVVTGSEREVEAIATDMTASFAARAGAWLTSQERTWWVPAASLLEIDMGWGLVAHLDSISVTTMGERPASS